MQQRPDGSKTGIMMEYEKSAALASGELSGEAGFRIPFTNWEIGGKGTVGGSVGGVGVGGAVGAYHDSEDGKFHFKLASDIALALGLNFDLDISIGPRKPPKERPKPPKPPPPPPPAGSPPIPVPGTPGVIITGFPTVLIG